MKFVPGDLLVEKPISMGEIGFVSFVVSIDLEEQIAYNIYCSCDQIIIDWWSIKSISKYYEVLK